MARPRPPTEAAVIEYMRARRMNYFFGDDGPQLPRGVSARWRVAPNDPHEWHGNMIGGLTGPPDLISSAVETAVTWFGQRGADTWVDADEWSAVYRHPALVEEQGFTLNDDWNVMACWHMQPTPTNSTIGIQEAQVGNDFMTVARIADAALPAHEKIQRPIEHRMGYYWKEFKLWKTTFVIAYLDDRAVGTARLTDEDVPVIVGVATLPEARGHGVATTLTANLVARALKTRGVCALYVDRGSQAERIYRRIGFVPLFRTRTWLRRWDDA